ncbi:MAG TPA: hypothetical protein VHT91_38505 [Kofleriaceae bacterium]|jgi:hypothetical protein|nr:hypothetical protein [Kofleriaceae bacterium]
MSDLQSQVQRTVQGFVAEVIELVRHAAVETLQLAFTDPAAADPAVARADRGPAAGSGRRRTQGDLDALARRLAIVIRANPGLRIAELGERLATPPRRLAVPIRKLIAEGTIEARGIRRATTYFAAAPDPPGAARWAAPPHDGLARPVPAGPAAGAPDEPAIAPAGGIDADWYRCLAGVLMLAHKLQK